MRSAGISSKFKVQSSKPQLKAQKLKIGVLDIQGSVEEHAAALKKCGAKVLFVKNTDDLARVNGLIIPGGESTHLSKMLETNGLFDALKKRICSGMLVFGTCAGAILLAKKIVGDKKVKSLGAIDIEIERNAYGRQLDSFEADLQSPALGKWLFHAVFIRAPKILRVGNDVRVLARHGKEIVFAREKNILVSTFHPELSSDLRAHKYFIEMAALAQ
ncbi:pyridoxal 5'-phosphate synthase glutaminase subunit PdxT [Candidatus Peregrinibacteria bacterium]|nr:pyridoxal 5'-phosphate synthase glutaminase subunit PdxT [Candidatus Peregrinibacteria bacterium]